MKTNIFKTNEEIYYDTFYYNHMVLYTVQLKFDNLF